MTISPFLALYLRLTLCQTLPMEEKYFFPNFQQLHYIFDKLLYDYSNCCFDRITTKVTITTTTILRRKI